MHRPSIHVVEVQGSPAKVAVQSEHTGTLFHEGASFSTHNELYELSCAHAAALNATGPPVTYKPLCEYNNPEVASRQMEQHITNLAPDTVMDLALTLHRSLTKLIAAVKISTSSQSPSKTSDIFHEEMSPFKQPQTPAFISVNVDDAFESAGTNPALRDALKSQVHYSQTHITNELARGRDEVGMKMVNQYTFLKELGRGRYGKVKLAIDDREKMVAIKVVPHRYVEEQKRLGVKHPVNNPENTEEVSAASLSPMEREVRVMSKLRHRNVIRLREVIDDPEAKHIYMVMDYAERGPLITVNPNGTSVPLYFDVAKGYMKQLGDGLHYLHKHNVVHRDIKPDNVLLSASGIVCFSDFGVSSFFSDTEFTYCEGTPAYHAPEICLGEKFRGPPTDVWALGVTFFMMVYGYQPFYSETASGLRKAIIEEPLQFPLYESKFAGHADNDDIPSMSMSFAPGSSIASLAPEDIEALEDSMLSPTNSSVRRRSQWDHAFQVMSNPKFRNHATVTASARSSIFRESSLQNTGNILNGDDDALGNVSQRPSFNSSSSFGGSPSRHDYKRYGGSPTEHFDLQDLLQGMLAKDPAKRLTISQVRHHAFFKHRGGETRLGKLMRQWDNGSMTGEAGKEGSPTVMVHHHQHHAFMGSRQTPPAEMNMPVFGKALSPSSTPSTTPRNSRQQQRRNFDLKEDPLLTSGQQSFGTGSTASTSKVHFIGCDVVDLHPPATRNDSHPRFSGSSSPQNRHIDAKEEPETTTNVGGPLDPGSRSTSKADPNEGLLDFDTSLHSAPDSSDSDSD